MCMHIWASGHGRVHCLLLAVGIEDLLTMVGSFPLCLPTVSSFNMLEYVNTLMSEGDRGVRREMDEEGGKG